MTGKEAIGKAGFIAISVATAMMLLGIPNWIIIKGTEMDLF
jgi:hypothetical protein